MRRLSVRICFTIDTKGDGGMARALAAVICAILVIVFAGTPAIAQGEPRLTAKAAALVEATSGRLLFGRNENARLPMASTTKVMTALVAIERGDLSDVITVPREACGVEGSSMYLEAGEKQTLENLLLGLMLRSGNDAAVAIAMHIGGSVESFADMMNETAARLGCRDTHFVNPHGLPADAHYTTAADLARIAAYAMCDEDFSRIVSTRRATVPWEGRSWDRAMANKNKLLYSYEGANGVKTGYTKAAGRCLVSGAVREDMQLVAVVLSSGPMYEECAAMLDYGFATFDMRMAVEKGRPLTEVETPGYRPGSVTAAAAEFMSLPMREGESAVVRTSLDGEPGRLVNRGDVLGRVLVEMDGMDALALPLVALTSARDNTYGACVQRVLEHW